MLVPETESEYIIVPVIPAIDVFATPPFRTLSPVALVTVNVVTAVPETELAKVVVPPVGLALENAQASIKTRLLLAVTNVIDLLTPAVIPTAPYRSTALFTPLTLDLFISVKA